MALQSQLFGGDPLLEKAAVSDRDHILPGSRGPHVAKIQQALIQVAGATIVVDGIYGPATAAAVADFKRRQNPPILNFAGKIDDIVGIKTMAALDAMLPKGPKPYAFFRYCGNDHTTPPVSGFRPILAFGFRSESATGTPSPSEMMTIARNNASQARVWLKSTLFTLNIFRLQVQIPPAQAKLLPTHAILNKHFRFDVDLFRNGPIIGLLSDPRTAQETVADLVQFYTKIDDTLRQFDRTFIPDMRDLAHTPGFVQFATSACFVPDPPKMDAIHVTPLYLTLGPLKRVAVLIHESTHFVSRTEFRDFSHSRSPDYPGPDYMPAIRNAYSYEQLATHMFLGADRRLQDSE
jgi:putative peptidoglycan binding protein